MSKYPILVAQWDDKHPADLAICERCEKTFTWDAGEGDPYDLCAKCDFSITPDDICGGQIVFKYQMTDCCIGCGKLGFDAQAVDGACSRVCLLQYEYAQQLAKERAA